MMIPRILILVALALTLGGIAALWAPPVYRAPGDCYFCGRPV